MRNPLIAIILFIIITFSCTTEQHDKSDKTNDTIEVCYLKGWRMSSIPVSCKEFAESVQQLDVDTTIFINKELFGELNKCFITKKQIDTLYCDTKILIKMTLYTYVYMTVIAIATKRQSTYKQFTN